MTIYLHFAIPVGNLTACRAKTDNIEGFPGLTNSFRLACRAKGGNGTTPTHMIGSGPVSEAEAAYLDVNLPQSYVKQTWGQYPTLQAFLDAGGLEILPLAGV